MNTLLLGYHGRLHLLVNALISLGDERDEPLLTTSTTRLNNTLLAQAPELAFLRSTQMQDQKTPWSA